MSKKEKIEKRNIKAKKLPGMFKKTYSEKKFNKKILKHIYIPSDKEFIQSLFSKGNNPKKSELFAIDKTQVFTKKEINKFKRLSKEIKSHKGRFNIGALVAVFSFLAILFVGGFLFKDTLIKIGLKKSCESIFNAKTEISSVKLDLIKSSLTIKKISIGDSNNEYKNLFEAGNICVDVNIPQAFRGRFVAENLSCNDMKFYTDRKTSCKLPGKKTEPKENKKEKSVSKENQNDEKTKTDNNEALNQKKLEAANLIKSNITSVLGSSDPQEIVNSVIQSFKSPLVIEESVKKSTELVEKWENKPAEVSNKVTDFYNSSLELSKIDVSKVPDVPTLMKDIELLNSAINKGNELKKEVEIVSKDVQTDFNTIQIMTSNVNSAIKEDKDFAANTLNSVKGLGKTASSVFENGLNSIGYGLMGKYYPYAKKALGMLEKLQKNKKTESKQKKEKKSQSRLEGTTFYYGVEYPEFLIEKIFISGENFNLNAEECTNNQDIRNKPMLISFNMNANNVLHSADLVVDARSSQNSSATINMIYEGKGFNANIDGSAIATKVGVPSLSGKTNIKLEGLATTQSFAASGSVSIPKVQLTSDGFENEMITKYYLQALNAVDKLNFDYKIKVDNNGPDFNLSGNFADQFVKALSTVASQIGSDAKKEALNSINKQLNSSNNEYLQKVKEFTGIKDDINVQKLKIENIQKELQNKVNEIQKRIDDAANAAKRQAEEAAKQAAQKAAQQANEAASQAAQQVTNQAADAAKNLLKGFGR